MFFFHEIYDDAINECVSNCQLEYYFSTCNSRQLCNKSQHLNCHLARMAETRELSPVNRSVISIALPDIHNRVYIRVRGNYLPPLLAAVVFVGLRSDVSRCGLERAVIKPDTSTCRLRRTETSPVSNVSPKILHSARPVINEIARDCLPRDFIVQRVSPRL